MPLLTSEDTPSIKEFYELKRVGMISICKSITIFEQYLNSSENVACFQLLGLFQSISVKWKKVRIWNGCKKYGISQNVWPTLYIQLQQQWVTSHFFCTYHKSINNC